MKSPGRPAACLFFTFFRFFSWGEGGGGVIFNEWITKKNDKKDKDTKKFDYTKLRLTDDYEYVSEKEEKKT